MSTKNSDLRQATSKPKRDGLSDEQAKIRLAAWRKAVERSQEVPLEYICFLIALELIDDSSMKQWQPHCRKHFGDMLREGRAVSPSFRREMIADPVSELTDYIQYNVDPERASREPEATTNAALITEVFNYFGLDPNVSSHCGFFLAI